MQHGRFFMSKVWEFFENMNEAVYASDVDTYELLYLNKAARDLFQFKDESDYKGKNCYEILQQCSSPCAMCTNNRLKPGVFYEWSRFNPLVRRSYLLKDNMVIDDGRRVRIEMAIDLDIHELAKRSFSEFTDNEALINEGLRCALAEETPEQSIDTLLQYLGQMFQSDRVYILRKINMAILTILMNGVLLRFPLRKIFYAISRRKPWVPGFLPSRKVKVLSSGM